MKELAIHHGRSEELYMLHDKAMLQVDGSGKYEIQASLDGEHWSVHKSIAADCKQHSRTVVVELLAGVKVRVVCVSGHMEAVRYAFSEGVLPDEIIDSEHNRIVAEAARIEAEQSREAAERERVNAEDDRESAEAIRVEAEHIREVAEQQRESAERARVQAETSREQAEAQRVNTFESNEATREATFETNEEARQRAFENNEYERTPRIRFNENNEFEASYDKGQTWQAITSPFASNIKIEGYADSVAQLPTDKAIGTVYGVKDAEYTDESPKYRVYVYTSNGWVDNGIFGGISAGVVQETGDSENVVMSQKAVSGKLAELDAKVGDRIEVYEDAVRLDEEDLYICDKNGNIVARIGAKGIESVGFGSSEMETIKNGKDDFKITDSQGNIILCLSANSSIDDIIRTYLEKRYLKPALSWIDDDFQIFMGDHGEGGDVIMPFYQAIHDWMIEKDIRMDFAYIPSSSEARMKLLHEWENENFRFLLHPSHTGWYAEYGNEHNPTEVRKALAECIRHFKENNILTDCKILVWPGSSHRFEENLKIVRNYIDCALTAIGTGTNQGLADDRYHIQRYALSLSATKTKSYVKAYLKECLERGDWVVLYTHLYNDSFVVSDVLDETTNSSANIKEIVEYLNSICPMRSTEEIWNERKFIYDYVKL